MSLAALYDTLRGKITNQSLALGPEVLDATSPILALLAHVTGVDTLPVRNVTLESPAGSDLKFGGTVSILGLRDVRIVGFFTLQQRDTDEMYGMSMTVILPDDWTFAQTFPAITGGEVVNADLLDKVIFQRAIFILSTFEYTDEDLAIDVVPGLNFNALMTLDDSLSAALDLVQHDGVLRLYGSVNTVKQTLSTGLERTYPVLDLTAEIPTTITLGNLKMRNLSFGLGSLVYNDENISPDPLLMFWLTLDGTFVAVGVTVALTATIPIGGAGEFEFAAVFDGATLPGFGDMLELFGSDDLADSLPDALQEMSGVSITLVKFGFQTDTRTVTYVQFAIEMSADWPIIPDVLVIKKIGTEWMVLQPFSTSGERSYEGFIGGGLAIGGDEGFELQATAAIPGWHVRAWLATGEIPVVALLGHFVPGISPTSDALTITALELEAEPANKTYSIAATVTNVWSIDFGFDDPLALEEISLTLAYLQNDVDVNITGVMNVIGKQFLLRATKAAGGRRWTFAGGLVAGDTINIPDIINGLWAKFYKDSLTIPSTVQQIEITRMEFSFTTPQAANIQTGQQAQPAEFSFAGEGQWQFSIGDYDFTIIAGLNLASPAPPMDPPALPPPTRLDGRQPRTFGGQLYGLVSFDALDSDFFENLQIGAVYHFHPQKNSLELKFIKDGFEINATAENQQGETVITIGFGDASFEDILGFLIRLVDPDVDSFTLDAPWDVLNSFNLKNLSLSVNLTTKAIGVTYAATLDLIFMQIDSFTLTYKRRTSDGRRTVYISLAGSFLGTDYGKNGKAPMQWDALNESPPSVPGTGTALLDIEYLGLGHHVQMTNVGQLDTIDKVMTALMGTIRPVTIPRDPTQIKDPLRILWPPTSGGPPTPSLVFSKDSEWLFGAKFSVLGMLSMSIIFNDPVIYGALIALGGPNAGSFAGLRFEILYRKVTDTIGVYHTELTLPDAMRQLEFGAVSITLPVVGIDIYTNGDFKLDVGFPWNGNWARSVGVDAFPFTGAGGFYFAKLSAETATSVPKIINGNFNPVLEFGIGLKIGLGKTFNKGPLKAEISITVQGILEGVLAWFNPNDPHLDKEIYYYFRGSITIVGRLYGAVDFKIIRIDVEVLVYAGVRLTIEAYMPIYIDLVAGVRVKASIKIIFITIKFSFSLEIHQQFIIGSAKPTPWVLAPGGAVATAAMAKQVVAPRRKAVRGKIMAKTVKTTITKQADTAAAMLAMAEKRIMHTAPFNWGVISVWKVAQTLDLIFQPAFTEGVAADNVNQGNEANAEVKGVALLFIENALKLDAETDAELQEVNSAKANAPFNRLAQALFVWALRAFGVQADVTVQTDAQWSDYVMNTDVELDDLRSLYDAFTAPAADLFDYDQLMAFFAANFNVNIADCSVDTSASVFPIIPELSLNVTTQRTVTRDDPPVTEEVNVYSVDFKSHNRISAEYLLLLTAYFRDLQAGHDSTVEPVASLPVSVVANLSADHADASDPSMATFLFTDYMALITRSVIQAAMDIVDADADEVMPLDNLLDSLVDKGSLNQIAGMASRFLLHGLRVPLATDITDTYPLYERTGQQFTITDFDPNQPYNLILRDNGTGWISFTDYDYSAQPDTSGSYPKTANPNQIMYTLQQYQRDLIRALGNINLNAGLSPALAMPLYEMTQRRFNFGKYTNWQASVRPRLFGQAVTGNPVTLWKFPQELLARAVATPDGEALSLTLHTATFGSDGQLEQTDVPRYSWATAVEISVRQVPTPDGTAMLPDTYQVLGTAETGQALLEDLWDYLPFDSHSENINRANGMLVRDIALYLLYPTTAPQNNPSGLQSDIVNSSLILKTNLSTMQLGDNFNANETRRYGATLSEPEAFLRLLWECSSMETGGYYLRYRRQVNNGTEGLPDYLFSGGQTATLTLLLVVETPFSEVTYDPLVHNFHNCVVMEMPISDDTARETIVFAEAQETVKTQALPSGSVGFTLTRPRPAAVNGAVDAAAELATLYQTLGYRVLADAAYKASFEGLPIGPTEPKNGANGSSGGTIWRYERVIPAYRLIQDNLIPADQEPNLPPSASSPYLGVAQNASVNVGFDIQDIYGNRLASAQSPAAITLPIVYFDPIVGINQWLGVAEHYRVETGNDDQARLVLSLNMDVTKYIATPGSPPADTLSRIHTARAIFETIYYQVMQPDLAFNLYTSLNPDNTISGQGTAATVTETAIPLEAMPFVEFVSAVYRFLKTLEASDPVTHTVTEGDTLQLVADAYGVTADELGAENATLTGLLPDTIQLPYFFRTRPGQTLRQIAAVTGIDVGDLLNQNLNVTGLLAAHSALTKANVGYTITATDTLTTLADAGFETADLVDTADMLMPGVRLFIKTQTHSVQAADTFISIVNDFNRVLAAHAANMYDAIAPGDMVRHNANMRLKVGSTPVIPFLFTLGSVQSAVQTVAGETPGELATNKRTLADMLRTNQNLWGIVAPGLTLMAGDQTITTLTGDTIRTLAKRFADALGKDSAANPVTLPEFMDAVRAVALFVDGAVIIVPPFETQNTLSFAADPARYHPHRIFPVTVDVEMVRNPDYVLADLRDEPGVASARATFTPRLVESVNNGAASLRAFAHDFETAFPGLKLAAGSEKARDGSSATDPTGRTLWAVHFGTGGIAYNIQRDALFFAPPPLTNTLTTGSVALHGYSTGQPLTEADTENPQQFEDVDLDAWLKQFFKAFDDFLDPAYAVPAYELPTQADLPNPQTLINNLLLHKERLAKAVADQVTHILETGINADEREQRRQHAATVLRQQMLISLQNAYLIETIVQHAVDVTLPTGFDTWTAARAPRLTGKPIVSNGNGHSQLDYALSTAQIPLTDGRSYLTFLYNTQSPTRDNNALLNLLYHVNELEYNIQSVKGEEAYLSSQWLAFILPPGTPGNGNGTAGTFNFDASNTIGEVNIPIPLRAYPASPSIIRQTGEQPAAKVAGLHEVREWQYEYTYEHLGIAQDSIETHVRYNVPFDSLSQLMDEDPASAAVYNRDALFAALANFGALYPAIARDLNILRADDPAADLARVLYALDAFVTLVHTVTDALLNWHDIRNFAAPAAAGDYRYGVQEADPEDLKTEFPDPSQRPDAVVTITTLDTFTTQRTDELSMPQVTIQAYRQTNREDMVNGNGRRVRYDFDALPQDEAIKIPGFGVPTLPDRTLIIAERDVIAQQNAWAAVGLTRNQNLISGMMTNPAFIYRTPLVRFPNATVPLIVNSIQWDIARIPERDEAGQPGVPRQSDTPKVTPLTDHLTRMFGVMLPPTTPRDFELQVACYYGYALAARNTDTAATDTLLTYLPVLLSTKQMVIAGTPTATQIALLVNDLAAFMLWWYDEHRPVKRFGRFIFRVNLFSTPGGGTVENVSLPLLQVEHLALRLQDMTDIE